MADRPGRSGCIKILAAHFMSPVGNGVIYLFRNK
jgi:hypothetical protein